MTREAKVIENVDSYLKKIKKKDYAQSTIKKKEQILSFFKNWLCEKNLQDLPVSEFNKKHLLKFKKYLDDRHLKKETSSQYLKTIYDLLEYPCDEKPESDVQQIVNHYFMTKGLSLDEIKDNTRKQKIIYSRYTKPAKDLISLAGSVKEAKKSIDKVAAWANSRNLDYAIETVFKKWPEINKLKPKEKKKRAYYNNDPMIWSDSKQKWYVIDKNGDWLEFAGDKKHIKWREED